MLSKHVRTRYSSPASVNISLNADLLDEELYNMSMGLTDHKSKMRKCYHAA